MTELVEAYQDSCLDEIEVCNNCLKYYNINEEGECCIVCHDGMTFCSGCLPDRNCFIVNGAKIALCDFCGATFRDTCEDVYDETFYKVIKDHYGVSKEDLIKGIKHLQNTWFSKQQMLDRVELSIAKLQKEIDDLREEARYIASLRED